MKRRGLERTLEVDISSVASGRDEVLRHYVSFGLLNLEVSRSGGNPKNTEVLLNVLMPQCVPKT